jgi:hypothetical protein
MVDSVQSATAYISKKLDSSGVFNTVTHQEMQEVAAKLKSLPAAQADAVIDNLAKSGDLKKLADEGVDGSWFGNGGFTASERLDFFKDMASKLDGQSLSALSNAFINTDKNGTSGLSRGKELASAVAAQNSPQVKLDFIKEQAKLSTDQKSVSDYGMVSQSIDADPQAAAIATVIGSMKGAQAAKAFESLTTNQLRAVMNASIEGTMTTVATDGAAIPSVSWDTKSFDKLMTAAASMPDSKLPATSPPNSVADAKLKAKIFDIGVQTMRSVRENGGIYVSNKAALNSMTAGLTRLIDSNVNGVIGSLSRNARDTRSGDSLSAYSAQMLASGQEAKLGQMMAKLQLGDSLKENPSARLDVTATRTGTTNGSYNPNAETLGYFVGSVRAGATYQTKNIQEQREMTTAILKSALSVIDKAAGVAKNVPAGVAASVGKEWVQYAVKAMIDDPTKSAGQMLDRAALPINPANDELAVGAQVTSGFNDMVDSVVRNAKP